MPTWLVWTALSSGPVACAICAVTIFRLHRLRSRYNQFRSEVGMVFADHEARLIDADERLIRSGYPPGSAPTPFSPRRMNQLHDAR